MQFLHSRIYAARLRVLPRNPSSDYLFHLGKKLQFLHRTQKEAQVRLRQGAKKRTGIQKAASPEGLAAFLNAVASRMRQRNLAIYTQMPLAFTQ